jgi:hypothetical protein
MHRLRSGDRLVDADIANPAPIKQEQVLIVAGDVLIEKKIKLASRLSVVPARVQLWLPTRTV